MGRILGVIAATTTASILLPAPAHADQWTYVDYLDNHGVAYPSVTKVIETGKHTCRYLREGVPINDIMNGMDEYLPYGGTEQALIITTAAREMCPDQLGRLQAYADGQGN